MTSEFRNDFSPTQSIADLLQSGQAKDVALVKHGDHVWRLLDLKKETASTHKIVIQGRNLEKLMRAVANGYSAPPSILTDAFGKKEFHQLAHSSFRELCRLIPGMESSEHALSRTLAKKKLTRAVSAASIIGKGLATIEKRGLEGRFVGQEQNKFFYWIDELSFRKTPRTAREIEILIDEWQGDKTTPLSLTDWEAAKREEWERLKPGIDFLPWIVSRAYRAREEKAFEEDLGRKPKSEEEFARWRRSQFDPKLMMPTWELKELSKTTSEAVFLAWKETALGQRVACWWKFKEQTGATLLPFADFVRLSVEYSRSGSTDTETKWILRHVYEKEKKTAVPPLRDNFPTFVQRLKFKQRFPRSSSEEAFKKWRAGQERELRRQWKGSRLPLPFEEWRAQQRADENLDSVSFVSLGEKERRVYQTECQEGTLMRNGAPLNTKFEKTLASGPGHAIFVIGPDDSLYCGSHIREVFHHSSFLGGAAVVAAGEVKTNSDGTIVKLSSKSGHYHPGDSQNLFMLRYFRDRGVDLSKVDFTFYSPDGETESRNALQYLQELESARPEKSVSPKPSVNRGTTPGASV